MENTKLPQFEIQPDWNSDLILHSLGKSLPKSTFWTNYTDTSKKTTFGKVIVESKNGILNLTSEDPSTGILVTNFDDKNFNWIKLKSPTGTEQTFYSPLQQYKDLHGKQKPIESLDISPQGELGVSGSVYGSLLVWESKTGAIRRNLEGHVGDVLTCKFFPSGTVILSGGTDCQIKLWNLMDGNCVATLMGHSGGVLSTSLIERGRNLISVSRDGSARLWETSTQSTISLLYQVPSSSSSRPINTCFLCKSHSSNDTTNIINNDKEYGTEGKMVIIGTEEGSLIGIDVRNKQIAFKCDINKPIISCTANNNSTKYFAGTEDGKIYEYSYNNVKEPLSIIDTNNSGSILNLNFSANNTIWFSTSTGITCEYDFTEKRIIRQLTGSDCEPVTTIVTDESQNLIYTGSRDGFIRKYSI